MSWLRGKLTFSNVVAMLALFIALGGAGYAATQLPKNSVGSKQLKKNAVTAAKVKNGAITPAKLNRASRTALAGPQGPQGPKGEAGSARAWAEVKSNGTVLRSVGGVTAERTEEGRYCLTAGALNTSNSVAVATLNYSDEDTAGQMTISIANTNTFNGCPPGSNAFQVLTTLPGTGTADAGFIFVIP